MRISPTFLHATERNLICDDLTSDQCSIYFVKIQEYLN